MKLKTLAFMLSMILLLGILTGCTPTTQDPTESYTVPNIESGTKQLPDHETAALTGEPVVTEIEPVSPESGTANIDDPTPAEPSSGELPTETDAQMEDPDEDGMEIESEYTFEIGDDLGIGGN